MTPRRMLMCVAVVALLGPAGCSTSEADDAPATGAATGAAAVAGGEKPAADDPAAAKDVCAYLTKELPRIQAVGSEVGAMAQLTMSLAAFYENHPKVEDGTVLDRQTKSACPETRTAMLKAAGMKSFDDF